MGDNAAISVLEQSKKQLTEGINSIPEQGVLLAKLRESLHRLEATLAQDKKALIQIDKALAILKAGEE